MKLHILTGEVINMKNLIKVSTIITAFFGFFLSTANANPMKVCYAFNGPIGEWGWNYQQELGRQHIQNHFGDKVETIFIEGVGEGADAERAIRKLAMQDCKIIFSTTFTFMDQTVAVAADYPDIIFEHATGYKFAENLGVYEGATYQGRYIAGMVAAATSQTGKVAYLASFPIPELIRDINAVALGMQRINPDAILTVVWLYSWFDPAKESDAVRVLVNTGHDVTVQHTDGFAAVQVAQELGTYAIGHATDLTKYGPDAHLTALEINWGPFMQSVVEDVINGTWKSDVYWGDMTKEAIVVTPFNEIVPKDTIVEAEMLMEQMRNHTFEPFTGPIKNQSGEIMIPSGKSLNHDELLSINYFVEGVMGDIPQ